MFKGENLTNIRFIHRLIRKQLGAELGVTEQGIWQYEEKSVLDAFEY